VSQLPKIVELKPIVKKSEKALGLRITIDEEEFED
jgi:hypothetical protein